MENQLPQSEETIKMTFKGIPSHCNITGNKTADAVAEEASELNPVHMEKTSLSNAIKHINSSFTET